MINMLKVLIAVFVLIMLLALATLGKDIKKWFVYRITKKSPVESLWIILITLTLLIVITIADFIKNKPKPEGIMITGLFMFFLGGIMQIIVKKKVNITLQEKMKTAFNKITTTGIYSKIRHPSKLAGLMMIIGLCLALKSLWGIIILITLFLPGLFYKIHQEEKILLDEYGERYFEYQDKTKKLIPKIL